MRILDTSPGRSMSTSSNDSRQHPGPSVFNDVKLLHEKALLCCKDVLSADCAAAGYILNITPLATVSSPPPTLALGAAGNLPIQVARACSEPRLTLRLKSCYSMQ